MGKGKTKLTTNVESYFVTGVIEFLGIQICIYQRFQIFNRIFADFWERLRDKNIVLVAQIFLKHAHYQTSSTFTLRIIALTVALIELNICCQSSVILTMFY